MRLALILSATLALSVLINPPISADEAPAVTKPTSSKSLDKSAADDPREIRIFTLRHVRVEIATVMLKQLGYEGGFTPDSRTNSLIANDNKQSLTKLEALLKAIDRPTEMGNIPHPRTNVQPMTGPFDPVGLPNNFLMSRESAAPNEAAPDEVRNLRLKFRQLDAQAVQTAAELRQLQTQPGKPGSVSQENDRVAHLQRKLRDDVTAAYDARTQMQQAEVHWLRERLSRIERQLENRGHTREHIIDRRVEDLLDPGYQWDPNLGATNDRGSDSQTLPKSDLSAREKKAQNLNNLKQLALAMHNFHDVFNHFPKAVSTARDSGRKTDTPHSWRIDLLPFLGGADLYQQYKMDEAWDGPNNKKLLDRMPAVFRSPYDDPKSMSTAYAVLVGKGTVFEPGREGIKISEITDGTSNTILVVEARRNCPWMKPEDIPFDADKPVPELGDFVEGKFAAVMADGRACIFERAKVEEILNWMIRRNDGHPIQIPFE
jgi:hypothetical protein